MTRAPSHTAALLALMIAGGLAVGGAQAAGKGLAKTDANGDGQISQQEFVAARGRVFERIDANHDGQITTDEVAAYRTRVENAEAGAMIRTGKARKGAGHQLERLEALTAKGPLTRAEWDAMAAKRFQAKDVAGGGVIPLDQMRARRAAAPSADPMAPQSDPKS